MSFNPITLFTGMGFSDVVDVMIITFLFYQILGYVKGTRALQLGRGLLVLLAAFIISEICEFYAFNWLLSKVLDIGLIALVVVFQPELRRGLELLGRGSFTGRPQMIKREMISGFVDQIVSAVSYFAGRKEGALIVIERNTALTDIAETGTRIDAELSTELLENVFYKGSPLHDGAAIIRGERLLAAGCVLPLTENSGLSKDLGTRHRAGIGISENSDALVLIVSEETGIISVAENGKLSRFLDLKTVEKLLLNYYLSVQEAVNPGAALLSALWRRKDDGTQENR